MLGASVQADITGPGGRLQHLRLEVTVVVTTMVVTKMLVMMIISN